MGVPTPQCLKTQPSTPPRPGVSTGPRGRRGCSRGGSPQSRGSGAQPQVARRRRRFFGAFLTDFHEVLLLFWDQLKPKNGYKYSHSSCSS